MNSPAAAEASTERHLAAVPDAGGLFAAYSSQIFAYCLHNLGSRSDAEDALQTTFLQAHRALRRGVVPECESAWLTAIAKNVCRWQRRTRARRATVSDEGLDVSTLPAPAGDDSRGAVADLKDALASIPERQRRALLLREWRGLQPSEIAPHLGASTSETYALLSRARRSAASALTAAARRPVLGIDFGSLLLQLRSLLASGPAAVGATAVAIGVGVAGVTVERAVVEHQPAKTRPALVPHAPAAAAPVTQLAHATRNESRAPVAARGVSRARTGSTSPRAAHRRAHVARPSATHAPRPATTRPSSKVAPAATPTATTAASAELTQANDSSPATPSRSAPPTLPPLPDPTNPLPVDLPPPVSTVVSTVNDTLQPPDQTPPATPDPVPAPLPQVPPPPGSLLP